MEDHKSNEGNTNPIRNLPLLIKAVREHKEKNAKSKKRDKKPKYVMRNKSGSYVL